LARVAARQPRVAARQGFNGNARQRAVCERGFRQKFMENECEALPGVAYPGVRDSRSTLNTKTGYDDDMMNR